jgi:WD40 repeat protein/tRNA A-37 threonylcarbamoyl transferase component Bud32
MTTLLRCVNGHEFEAGSPGSQVTTCPVCGAPDRTLQTPPTLPGERPSLGLSGSGGRGNWGIDVPPILSRYEILEELGKGGMGVVYKARQRDTGRLVALKVIRKERLANPDMLSRFRREAQASARLAHPAIVQVLEADQDGDVPYLVMEYVAGITLQKLVEETGPLHIAQACDFVRQAALGLQHAAEQRLVHRDIKPSNLMVVAPTGLPLPARPVVKILDMGVARVFQLSEQEVALTTLTRDGSVIGTPDYIAPEQLEDPRTVDIRADLYSLGCTFYYLLAGQVPFPGGTLVQKLDRQRWQTAPSVNQIRHEVPAPLAAVIRRLMAKHPDDRYQSPGELASALEALLKTGELPGGYAALELVPLRVLTGHSASVTAVAFDHDGKSLFSGSSDRTVRVWDVSTGQERLRVGDGRHEVSSLAVVPGSGMVLAGQGVTVRGLDPVSGKEMFKLTGHNDAVRCLSVSADGKRAVSGSDDRIVRVWDLPRALEIRRFNLHRAGVTGVALSADGRLVLSGSRDGSLRLWESATGKELRVFAVPRGPVLCVALSGDGEQAYSGHFDTTLRLWEASTGRELRRFTGHRQMVGALACSPSALLVSGSHDQTVRLWDPASGAELAAGQGHTAAVTAVAVTGDGKLIASAGLDQTVRIWQVP